MCIAIIRAKYRDNTRHDFDAADEPALEKRVAELGANEQCLEIRIFRTEGKLVRRSEMVFRPDVPADADPAVAVEVAPVSISEYDGPTAWVDMTAIEKMRAVLNGDVAEADELEIFRQAIDEAALAERRHVDALDENRRLRAQAKAEPWCWEYEIDGELAFRVKRRIPADEKPDGYTERPLYTTPPPDHAEALAEALQEIMSYEGGAESPLEDQYVVDRAQSAITRYKERTNG